MTSREIRQSFLDFFRARGHAIVPSSPVVIPADPTLLFANAGMNQFKDYFLGARQPETRRVADTQKCIRVSGKHNDLEEVGRDTYHHTFFEMLGNWSFGDYYKREAIVWAWELLTSVWKLPKDRLWVTVYRTDDETARIWAEETDVLPAHILRFGEKENFWEMGETGPCGPCSEIHFDRTPNGCAPEMVNAGLPEVMEIWNLVFMQHNRRSDGVLEDLPARHVDTGMGFERITAVLQGKASNYDTDIFMPLIEALARLSGRPYRGEDAVAMRVIADHVRTLAFAIADGVLPSNEGRGYVLRRLLRRAARFGRRLGLTEPFLGALLPVLEQTLGDVFPELRRHRPSLERALRAEEENFALTLDRGLALFDEVVAHLRRDGGDVFPGDEAFKLYDTYGFPLDLTRLMAAEQNLRTDEEGFERRMAEQRDRARGARKGADDAQADRVADLIANGLRSAFTGYETLEGRARLIALLGPDGRQTALAEGTEGLLLLDRTPFYGESGGQVGDTGRLTGPQGEFHVTDTRKPADGVILHSGRVIRGELREGEELTAQVDAARRRQTANHHTATHLLNAALREVVGPSIKQAGSRVAPDRMRFDFTWFEGLSPDTLGRIEERVNEWIAENREVKTYPLALRDVAGTDIVALFDEKYGDTVRVVEVSGVSRELCGGTHVPHTGQLAMFRIVSEGAVASGIRRIEALCGLPAYQWTRQEHETLKRLCQAFSATAEELPARIDALLDQNRRLEKELKQQEMKSALAQVAAMAGRIREAGGIRYVAECAGDLSMDALRSLLDGVRAAVPEAVLLLGSRCEGKACFVAAVSPADVARGVHAGRLIGQVAKLAGGGGGGQPQKAQAGGKDGSKVEAALAAAPDILAAMVKKG